MSLETLKALLAEATPRPWTFLNHESEIMAEITWHGPEDEEYPVGEHLFEVPILEPIRYDWQKGVDPVTNALLAVDAVNALPALIALAEQALSMWEDGSWDKATVRKALTDLDYKSE